MTVKNVIARDNSIKKVVISSKSIQQEREAVFALEDAEFMMWSPGVGRLYHPAGIPLGVIETRLFRDSFFDGKVWLFNCNAELAAILTKNCKQSNRAISRVKTHKILSSV